MSKKINKADSKRLNALIEKLGLEAVSVDDEGNPITRFDQLAELIWNRALGFIETDPKTNTDIIHKPDKHFINLIYDRMEGKIPTASSSDDKKKASLADRVSDQTRSRLNAMAEDDV